MTKTIYLLVVLLLTAECIFAQSNKQPPRASIHPSIVKMNAGEQQKFKVIKMASPLQPASLATNVQWFVNDIPGGNKKVGITFKRKARTRGKN